MRPKCSDKADIRRQRNLDQLYEQQQISSDDEGDAITGIKVRNFNLRDAERLQPGRLERRRVRFGQRVRGFHVFRKQTPTAAIPVETEETAAEKEALSWPRPESVCGRGRREEKVHFFERTISMLITIKYV